MCELHCGPAFRCWGPEPGYFDTGRRRAMPTVTSLLFWVVLYRCPTGLHCLHACTRNSPLMSSALHRTHFDPAPPPLHPSCLVEEWMREEAILNPWTNSHFLSCSCILPIRKIAPGEMSPYMQTFAYRPLPLPVPVSLCLEFVYATGWYRNSVTDSGNCAALGRLNQSYFSRGLKFTFCVVPELRSKRSISQSINQSINQSHSHSTRMLEYAGLWSRFMSSQCESKLRRLHHVGRTVGSSDSPV